MNTKKIKKGSDSKFDTWIKVIPIVLTTIGLVFGSYQWYASHKRSQSELKTWEQKKQTYQDLLSLIGEIGAAKDNDSLLRIYSPKFDAFYLAKMKQAEGNDTLLIFQMMMMKKDIKNSMLHKNDFYQSDKLGKTCKKLSDQISETIKKGDEEF